MKATRPGGSRALRADVVLLGGGIAALWTACRLRERGYATLLLTRGDLGSGQTLAAQGVIHGGLKYALGGKLTDSSEALAAMPERWETSLRGTGEIDLRGVDVLAESQILWSLPQVLSRVVTFFGGQALRNRAQRIPRKEYPAPFDTPAYRGTLFRIGERVVDPVSLVRVLAETCAEGSRRLPAVDWVPGEPGVEAVNFRDRTGEGVTLRARHWIFAAGAGNEELLCAIGRSAPRMQRRPLHQVVLRSPSLPPLFSVCFGSGPKPPVVTTTHVDAEGERLWYVGGELAESGVNRSESEQIEASRDRFTELMPWRDWSDVTWSTLRVDRAEPDTGTGDRPPGAFCRTEGNVTTAWPTKLALAPDLADQVLESLEAAGVNPSGGDVLEVDLPRPAVGRPPWEQKNEDGG